ncbi:prephenate dehydrogenase [Alkalibacter saccharofermentans]|uniref:Prephenate dehydrogenase n=1 Tax=Alkalibacter saccharofermentans DSM 14828 TaxID=1120975 RepID=A0A1M4THA2_9FIRM|nr:prephenate dehydrogenase [Alkalibacter saccharofermentans]SHE43704.1 prephenate dehydrogenase [Alkalibacter saccharofermentans DSM 14828]
MEEIDFKNKKVLIVGLGLMGSAYAASFRNIGFETIYALDRNNEVLKKAESEKLIDKGYQNASDILPSCDLVVVCLYLHDALDFIKKNMNNFKSNSVITDIVGLKRKMVENLDGILRDDVDFIPGHPMAGREKNKEGFTSAKIFEGKNYILTPTDKNKPENLDMMRSLISKMGFGRLIETDPDTHDEKIAFTSQLCHIIAASMVDISEDSKVTQFEGGSFQDMTRIAMINSDMWAELFIANKDKLVDTLDEFTESISYFRKCIEDENFDHIKSRFDFIGKKREEMGK